MLQDLITHSSKVNGLAISTLSLEKEEVYLLNESFSPNMCYVHFLTNMCYVLGQTLMTTSLLMCLENSLCETHSKPGDI